jgi:4-carboxymuconolactone decarboxylase
VCEGSPETTEEKTTMSHSARYERGLAKFVEMYGERTKAFLESLEGIAPDLGTYVMEFAFGDIHSRPGLSLQSRELATVAALTAMGTAAPQLRAHIDGALNVGCSEQEIVEVIMQMSLYAGFPAAINGIQAAREVFLERSRQK